MIEDPSLTRTFPQARALLDRALELPNGLSIRFPDHGAAIRMRFNCYYNRKQARLESKLLYEPNSPQFGRSPWEELTLTLERQEDGSCLLKITPGMISMAGLEIRDPLTGELLETLS